MDPATLSTFFKGLDFPASRGDIRACAKNHKAPDDVIGTIDQVPEKQYGDMGEFMDAYSQASVR